MHIKLLQQNDNALMYKQYELQQRLEMLNTQLSIDVLIKKLLLFVDH